MKTITIALLGAAVLFSTAYAQDRKVPEYDAALKKHADDVLAGLEGKFDQALAALKKSYAGALERSQKAAQETGKLEEALALKNEATALSSGVEMAPLNETAPAALKKLRTVFEQTASKIDKDRQVATAPFNRQFQTTLDELVTSLTKAGRLEDALFVKQKRDALATATPAIVTSNASGGENVFTNTLGMKFIPLQGTKVMMCIHETRRTDYAAYAAADASANGSWKSQSKNGVPAGAEDNHPVVGVSWSDARDFCVWLSKKEGKTYRLPTDREWSYAVGVARNERKDASPDSMSGKIKEEYPWGSKWPPPKEAGNFADADFKTKLGSDSIIEGYSDGFVTTAPVMSFPPNKLGFHDLAGNVWEWCEEWYNSGKVDRVSRGGSWTTRTENALLSSYRDHTPPDRRDPSWGFRCVLESSP